MIKKINTIQKLGIFEDYSVDGNLENFAKFNLIYGWNGSGKTTFSELFKAFKSGELEEFPDLKYTITCSGNNYSNTQAYDKNIHVFNQKYVADNVNVVLGNIKPIFMLGKVNLDLLGIIQKDEKKLSDRKEALAIKEQKVKELIKDKNKFFKDVAKIISADISRVSARNYNKNNAEEAFDKLESKKVLSQELIEEHRTTLEQQEKQQLTPIETTTTKALEGIINDSKNILNKTVENVVIDRLKNNPNISKWVEEGIYLHKETDLNNCEFCNQQLPVDRIPQLLSYFNDADKSLKKDIESLLERTRIIYSLISKLSFMDEANLYDEFQKDYKREVENLKTYKEQLLKKVKKLDKEITDKKQHTTEVLTLQIEINDEQFMSSIVKANIRIEECNQKTRDFSNAKKNAESELEKHYLSEILDEVNSTRKEIGVLENECKNIREGDSNDPDSLSLTEIQDRINNNKNKTSTSETACEEMNEQLKTFLGRDDLIFEVVEGGYEVKRNGKTADRLSEGEKTAIAFVYFTIHLKDRDFDISKEIIVIDDPISSMDSNSIFQAFSFLKNSVKDANQVFILTHNFDFLKLVLGWMKRDKKNSHYFMIKNLYKDETRIAMLDKLDDLLKNYDTEYQYLFKLLIDFKTDETIESVYHIPNIARKTLESFLLFMVPNGESPFKKLKKIEFDENKKTAIYKFTNDQSHKTGAGFDPSLVVECQKNVQYLLEMIEITFPKHYEILKENSQH
ncbi:AAA family ATPase [thiotrophic endosymbiont of Bathymodiolus puteoserpentis (Logatchev)]|uniref:AAA family ATPase n=1 Tax=thiotrophic endosymbiont of Bathymodiolus puteoserpentis (Logatchev) TaxID=343240 RepID=UPI0010B67ED1|nr:AAA family ATPase [thiotrophic endosymbiont of Bathymodiolus puteoserpentis (Logatchev)]SSC10571.1 Translation-disabling ACNase RloC [thiotrophic endosymbiont of Bathymodiolus puteoserpentis (Logatchev)]